MQIALKVTDADAFRPDPAVEVVTPFEDTHYGTGAEGASCLSWPPTAVAGLMLLAVVHQHRTGAAPGRAPGDDGLAGS
jgi:hypothetical protein